jgi:KaiC/GvpD/RAD55 family RecA-like ATPase
MVDKNPIVYDILLPEFIPKIMDFPYGYTLLLKGAAGTGKSTLAMEICMQYLDQSSMIFLSTRSNLEDLSAQYAAFVQKVGKDTIKDLNAVGMSEEKLKQINIDADSFLNIFFDFEKVLKDIAAKNAVAQQQGAPQRKTIVIIDSIEKMIESIRKKKAVSSDALIYETLVEYARKYALKLFIVAETAEMSPNDYLVDGIITLYRDIETIPDRILRTMSVQKLRNMSIDQQVIVFTLYQGRFRTMPNLKPRITILPIDQQVHAIHSLMDGNQFSQLFFINLFQAKNLFVELDSMANSVLTMWHVIFTVVALLNKIPVFFVAPTEMNIQRFVKALISVFGEEHVRKYFRLGFLPKPRVAADWNPDYLLVSQSNDFLEELRSMRGAFEEMRKVSSNKAILAIVPLDSVFLNYQHETLPKVYQHARDGIFTEADTILWTNLALEDNDPLCTRFVDSVSSRVIFAMKGVQVAKTQILYWMKLPRPAYCMVPKFVDKPFKLEKLDIIPLV